MLLGELVQIDITLCLMPFCQKLGIHFWVFYYDTNAFWGIGLIAKPIYSSLAAVE